MGDQQRRRLTNPADRERLMKAIEQYFDRGSCSEACDRCGQLIEVQQLTPRAWKHGCPCGKYQGSLRGL